MTTGYLGELKNAEWLMTIPAFADISKSTALGAAAQTSHSLSFTAYVLDQYVALYALTDMTKYNRRRLLKMRISLRCANKSRITILTEITRIMSR